MNIYNNTIWIHNKTNSKINVIDKIKAKVRFKHLASDYIHEWLISDFLNTYTWEGYLK